MDIILSTVRNDSNFFMSGTLCNVLQLIHVQYSVYIFLSPIAFLLTEWCCLFCLYMKRVFPLLHCDPYRVLWILLETKWCTHTLAGTVIIMYSWCSHCLVEPKFHGPESPLASTSHIPEVPLGLLDKLRQGDKLFSSQISTQPDDCQRVASLRHFLQKVVDVSCPGKLVSTNNDHYLT